MSMNGASPIKRVELLTQDIRVVTPRKTEEYYATVSSTEEENGDAEEPETVEEIISLSASTTVPNFCGFENFESHGQPHGNKNKVWAQDHRKRPTQFSTGKSDVRRNNQNADLEYSGSDSDHWHGTFCNEAATDKVKNMQKGQQRENFMLKKRCRPHQMTTINDIVPSTSTETLTPSSSSIPVPIQVPMPIVLPKAQISGPALDHIVEINSDSTTQTQRQKRQQIVNKYQGNWKLQEQEQQYQLPAHSSEKQENSKARIAATHATITTTTATMHKNEYSSESTSEFPLSSPSNPQEPSPVDGVGRGVKSGGDKYKNSTQLLKNTLPADSIERQLVMINTYKPQMSLNERIQLWHCEQSVSDVEDVKTFDDEYKRFEEHKKELMQHFVNYKHLNIENELAQMEYQTEYRHNQKGISHSNVNNMRKYADHGNVAQTPGSLDTKLYVMAKQRGQNYYNSSESEEYRGKKEKPSTSALAIQRRRFRIQSALARSGLERLDGTARYKSRLCKNTLKKRLQSTTPPSSLSSSEVELTYMPNNKNSIDNSQTSKKQCTQMEQQEQQQRVEVYDKILCRSSSEEEQKQDGITVPLAVALLAKEGRNLQMATDFNDNTKPQGQSSTKQLMPTSPIDAKTEQQSERLNESMGWEGVAMQQTEKHQIEIQEHLDFAKNSQNQNLNHDYDGDGDNDKKINELEIFKSPVVPQKYNTTNIEVISSLTTSLSAATLVPVLPTNSVICLTKNNKQEEQIDSQAEKCECDAIATDIAKSTETATAVIKIKETEATTTEDNMLNANKKPEEINITNDDNDYTAANNAVALGKGDTSGHGDNGVYHQQYEFCSYLGLTGMSTAAAMANAVAELAQCNMARRSMRVLRQQHKERLENYNKSRRDLEDLKLKQIKEIRKRERGGQDLLYSSQSQSQTEPSERSVQTPSGSLTFSIRTSDIKSSPMTLINGKTLKDTSVTLLKREPEIKILCHINASSKEEIEMKSKECVKEIVQPIKDTIKRQLEEQLQQKTIRECYEIKAGIDNSSKSHCNSDGILGFAEMPTTSKKALEALALKSCPSSHDLLKPIQNSRSILENCLSKEMKVQKIKVEQKEQQQLQSKSPLHPTDDCSKPVPGKSETVGDILYNVSKITPHLHSIIRKTSSEREAKKSSTTPDVNRLGLFHNIQNALIESRKVKPKVFIIESIDSNANHVTEKSHKSVRITAPFLDKHDSTKDTQYNVNNEQQQHNEKVNNKEVDDDDNDDNDDDVVSEVSYSPTPPVYSPINTPTSKIEIRKQQLRSPFTTNNNSASSSNLSNNRTKNTLMKRSTAQLLKKTVYANTRSRKAINKIRLMSFKRPKRRQLRKRTKLIIIKTIKSATRKIHRTTSNDQSKGDVKKVEKAREKRRKNRKNLTTRTATSTKMNDKLLSSASSISSASVNHDHHYTKDNAISSSPVMMVKRVCGGEENIVNCRHMETETQDFEEYLKQLQQDECEQQLKSEQEQQQHQLSKLRRKRLTVNEAVATTPLVNVVVGGDQVKTSKFNLKRTRTQIIRTGNYVNATPDLSPPRTGLFKRKKKLTYQQSVKQAADGVKDNKINQNIGQESENNVVVSSTTNSYDQIIPATTVTNNIAEPCSSFTPPINTSETAPNVFGSVSYVIMGTSSPIKTKDEATQSTLNNSIRYLNVTSVQQSQHPEQQQQQNEEQNGSMNERRRHQKRLNGMRNPLKDDFGKVLHIYYELDVLIVIQELLVTFWKSSKLLNILTTRSSSSLSIPMKATTQSHHHHNYNHNYYHHNQHQHQQHNSHQTENNEWMNDMDELAPSSTLESNYMGEWLLLGELRYLTYDHEITATYANRICVHNSIPIYVEMRGRPMPQHQRECHLLCMYVNIYYYNDEERLAKFASIHLDSIQSDITQVNYTAITDSRYFIMTWPKENILNKSRSGICKYSLTPQLDTLASIRSFNSMCHIIHHMECMIDDKLIGFGDSQVTVWDHRSGDVLMNYDLVIPLGRNLASIYYHSQDLAQLQSGSTGNVLILYQYRHFNDNTSPELLILACNISHTTPSYSILHQYALPVDEVPGLNSATTTGDHIILNTVNDQEIWISCTNPNLMICVPTATSSDGNNDCTRRFYGRHRHHVIELNEKTLNVDNLANLLLKLAAGGLTHT